MKRAIVLGLALGAALAVSFALGGCSTGAVQAPPAVPAPSPVDAPQATPAPQATSKLLPSVQEKAFAETLNLTFPSPEFTDAWTQGEAVCDAAKAGATMADIYALPYSPYLAGVALGVICPANIPAS